MEENLRCTLEQLSLQPQVHLLLLLVLLLYLLVLAVILLGLLLLPFLICFCMTQYNSVEANLRCTLEQLSLQPQASLLLENC